MALETVISQNFYLQTYLVSRYFVTASHFYPRFFFLIALCFIGTVTTTTESTLCFKTSRFLYLE